MKLISTFDFLDMFPEGKSLAVVGNAPSLVGSGLGEWIDGFDTVVRFNGCALDGYQDDVGSKTDILVTHPYTETRDRPPVDGGSCRLILVISPQTRRGNRENFEAWAGDHKILFTYTPDLAGGERFAHKTHPTTGVAALALLNRTLKPSYLVVMGFTMFLDDTAHKYWSAETPPGVAKHDMVRSAELLVALINDYKEKVEVTADIAWLAARVGQKLNQRVLVRPLPGSRWQARSPNLGPA